MGGLHDEAAGEPDGMSPSSANDTSNQLPSHREA